uniref:Uncharacterized protein n=1 Tax=Timema shepardi TaxID=629360 RepID=A0A7R9G0M1_TIMSH|nr:unnamed protein product [Timema shepardi]
MRLPRAENDRLPNNFMSPELLGDLLYKNYILTIPTLLDMCLLYGRDCQSDVADIISTIFIVQPAYFDDLQATVAFIIKTLQFVEWKFGNSTDVVHHSDIIKLSSVNHRGALDVAQFRDLVIHVLDTAATLSIFLGISQPACEVFHHQLFELRAVTCEVAGNWSVTCGTDRERLACNAQGMYGPKKEENLDAFRNLLRPAARAVTCEVAGNWSVTCGTDRERLACNAQGMSLRTNIVKTVERSGLVTELSIHRANDYPSNGLNRLSHRIKTDQLKPQLEISSPLEEMYRQLEKLVNKEETQPLYVDLKHKLDITRVEFLNTFRHILGHCLNCCIEDKPSLSEMERKNRVEDYMSVLTECLSEKVFMRDYHKYFPVDVDLELLSMVSQEDCKIDGVTGVQLDSLITEVQDILPHLGEGFIQAGLQAIALQRSAMEAYPQLNSESREELVHNNLIQCINNSDIGAAIPLNL